MKYLNNILLFSLLFLVGCHQPQSSFANCQNRILLQNNHNFDGAFIGQLSLKQEASSTIKKQEMYFKILFSNHKEGGFDLYKALQDSNTKVLLTKEDINGLNSTASSGNEDIEYTELRYADADPYFWLGHRPPGQKVHTGEITYRVKEGAVYAIAPKLLSDGYGITPINNWRDSYWADMIMGVDDRQKLDLKRTFAMFDIQDIVSCRSGQFIDINENLFTEYEKSYLNGFCMSNEGTYHLFMQKRGRYKLDDIVLISDEEAKHCKIT